MGLFGFGRDQGGGGPSEGVHAADPPVSEKMIWICEKCGFKLADEDNENPSRRLQKSLKSLASEQKRKREVRAMVTSCLNVCPKGRIAVALADLKSGQLRFLELDYDGREGKTAETVYRLL